MLTFQSAGPHARPEIDCGCSNSHHNELRIRVCYVSSHLISRVLCLLKYQLTRGLPDYEMAQQG